MYRGQPCVIKPSTAARWQRVLITRLRTGARLIACAVGGPPTCFVGALLAQLELIHILQVRGEGQWQIAAESVK